MLVERRAAHPVLDLRLFGGRMLAMANLASFCNAVARCRADPARRALLPGGQGRDAFAAALRVLPVPIGMAVASPLAGALGRRVAPYWLSVGGSLFSSAGLLVLLLSTDPATPYWILAAGLFVCGCGSGTFLTGNTTQVMSALPRGQPRGGERLPAHDHECRDRAQRGPDPQRAVRLGRAGRARPRSTRARSRVSPVALEQLMTGFQRTYAVLFAVALPGAFLAAMARSPPLMYRGA